MRAKNPSHQTYAQIPNNPKQWLPGLDFLRASAIFLVLIGHGKILLDSHSRLLFDLIFPMPAAWGVEFFFALSGYLIGLQWLELINSKILFATDSKEEVRLFFTKRWLRTMPTYWICLVLYLCLGFSAISQSWPIWAMGNIFLISSLINIPAAIPVSWTLAIEELSYLWIGLSAWLIGQTALNKTHSDHALLIFPGMALATGTITRLYAASNNQWSLIHHGTLQRVDALAYGILAAWAINSGIISPRFWGRKTMISMWALCATLILLLQDWCDRYTVRLVPATQADALVFAVFIIPALGICSAIITGLLATQFSSRASQIANPAARRIQELAKVSYTIYLTHIPLRLIFSDHDSQESPAKFFAYICTAIALGAAAYPIIEGPFMALRKRYVASRRARAVMSRDSSLITR